MAVVAGDARFEMGRVVGRTFSVYGRNFVNFTILSALAVLPYVLITYYIGKINPLIANGVVSRSSEAIALACMETALAFSLQAAIVHGTLADLSGNRATFGECLSASIKTFLPLIAMAFLTLLGCWAAACLLIVPGIMLCVAWFVVVPAYVIEHTGVFGAFGRSRELTRGFRWPIFGLALIYCTTSVVCGLAIASFFSVNLLHAGTTIFAMPFLIASTVWRILIAVVFATGIASIYFELRTVKENGGPQALAAAFD